MLRNLRLKRFFCTLLFCSAALGSAHAAKVQSSSQPVLGSNDATAATGHEDMSPVVREAYRQWDAQHGTRAARQSSISTLEYTGMNGCPAQPAVRRISYRPARLGRTEAPVHLRAHFGPMTRSADVRNLSSVPNVSCNALGRLISIEAGPSVIVRRVR